MRLAMQLLARYATWIQQGMQQRAQALEAAAAKVGAPAPAAPGQPGAELAPKVLLFLLAALQREGGRRVDRWVLVSYSEEGREDVWQMGSARRFP